MTTHLRVLTLTPTDDEILRELLPSLKVKVLEKTAVSHLLEIEISRVEDLTTRLKEKNLLFEKEEPLIPIEVSEVDYGSDTILADIPLNSECQLGEISILEKIDVTRYKLRLPSRKGNFPHFQNVTVFDPTRNINLAKFKSYNVRIRKSRASTHCIQADPRVNLNIKRNIIQSLLKADCEITDTNDCLKVRIFGNSVPEVLFDSSLIDEVEPDVPATICGNK